MLKKNNNFKLFIIIIFVTFTGAIGKTIARDILEERKVLENNAAEHGFLISFYLVNTTSVEEFCRQTGYIPKKYISEFTKAFSPYKQKIILLEQNKEIKEIKKDIINLSSSSRLNQIAKDYETVKKHFNEKGYKLPKDKYCMIYDEFSSEMIKDKINYLTNVDIKKETKKLDSMLSPEDKNKLKAIINNNVEETLEI